MSSAIPPGVVLFITHRTSSIFSKVFLGVLRLSSQFKIAYQIIKFVSVSMVNDFVSFKVSSYFAFHDNSVLPNITISTSTRMVGYVYKNVTIPHGFSSLPVISRLIFRKISKITLTTITRFTPSIHISPTRVVDSFFTQYAISGRHYLIVTKGI